MSVISTGSQALSSIFNSITAVTVSLDKGVKYSSAALDLIRAKQQEDHKTELKTFIQEDLAEKAKRVKAAMDTISDPMYQEAVTYLKGE